MTIQDFRADYSKELFEHYLVLPDFDTAEQYIVECCGLGTNILDFASTYGASAAKELSKFYEKGYHKIIEVSPALLEPKEDCEEELLVYFVKPVFIATYVSNKEGGFLSSSLFFSLAEPCDKPKTINRYQRALQSARLFKSVVFGEISTRDFKREIDVLNPGCEYGAAIVQNTITGGIMLASNSNDNRFNTLYDSSPDGYWHEISFTDFQDDDETDPSESERTLIETEIEIIYDDIQAEVSSNEVDFHHAWDEALEWARKIEDVWTNKLCVQEFITMLRNPQLSHSVAGDVKADPDRPANLIVAGDRFHSILRGSNSLWDYLTDTDFDLGHFDLGPGVVIPPEDHIDWVNDEIRIIKTRLLTL